MRGPTQREQAAVFLIAAGLTRLVLDALARRRPAYGGAVPSGATHGEVIVQLSPGRAGDTEAKIMADLYRRRYGAHRPGLN